MPLSVPIKEIAVGDDLVLRMLRMESAPAIFRSIDMNRQYLRKWLPFVDNTWKVDDTELFIKSVAEASGPKRDVIYEIWFHNEFAGLIALKEIDRWNRRTELGYWIDPRFEGQGITTRCCISLLDCAFNKMGMHRVQIKAGVGNARSCRIPEKLGFKLEGIERAGEKNGKDYINLEVYSMLKNEWNS